VSAPTKQPALTLASASGRWVLIACVLGSGLAGIDATVVNIALPDIGRDLHASFAALQWTITAYTLTLASLILLGGSLGDRFGRRRIFVIGIGWFAVASALCAMAPNATFLIAARALQGVGGALLTPASLAILQATFTANDRARAIGAWSGLSGAASAIAPFLGGWLLQIGSWRWVFLINPPFAVVVILVALRHMPESRDEQATGRIDVGGAVLGVLGLGGVTAAIIAAADHGPGAAVVYAPAVAGVVALVAFVLVERRETHPMLPLSLFRSRQFSAANAVTFLLYAANGGSLLLVVIALQTVAGFSALAAGTALLPITVVMLLLAARFGALAQRIGPRLPMTIGPLIVGVGLALISRLSQHSDYPRDVLPALTVMGLGLAVFVAPLTATVLGAVPAAHAGVASGVNNAVARAASLLAIAALPAIVGITGDVYADPVRFLSPFRHAMWICVGLQVAGAVLAALTIGNDRHARAAPAEYDQPAKSVGLAGDPCLSACAQPADAAPAAT
jgi:EmrB/QacA subfamily drug resistance transporter